MKPKNRKNKYSGISITAPETCGKKADAILALSNAVLALADALNGPNMTVAISNCSITSGLSIESK